MHSLVHAFLTQPPYNTEQHKLILSHSPGSGTSTYMQKRTLCSF